MTDQLSLLTSALADRYTIERALGAGGMATVYLAHDLKHDRKVAVKVLRPELAAALGSDRFVQEVRIAAKLTHPHILPLFDSGEAGGLLYYVMPYIDGESLRERLDREGALPIEEATRIVREVADALASAHRQGVVHRDIKPDNVMLAQGHAMVTDFGVAKAVSEATGRHEITTAGVAIGTPAYMAPEQAAASSSIDHRADIYSLGVLAYELFAGRTPFSAATAQAVLAAHVTHTPEPVTRYRNTVPADLERLVLRCLEKAPADRFQTVDEMLPLLDSGATSGASPVRAVAADGWPRRAPWIASVAVALALGMAFLFTRGTTGPSAAEETAPSIAVLPFEDPGASGEERYFADGMAETLAAGLNRVRGLRVAAQTSAFMFRGPDVDLAEVGQALGVATVLRGGVQRAGDRLRVTVRLESTDDAAQLWSDQFDGRVEDVFAIQDSVARSVVDALQITLLGPAGDDLMRVGTRDVEAYHAYLQGRYFLAQRGAGIAQSIPSFERAVELDPQYAMAHAGLADAISLLGLYGGAAPDEVMDGARRGAERALALDSTSAETHYAAALVDIIFAREWASGRARLERALALDSSYAPALLWYGLYHYWIDGDLAQGIEWTTRAVAEDPLWPNALGNAGVLQALAGRHDEAMRMVEDGVALDPGWITYRYLAIVANVAGRPDRARTAADSSLAMSNRHPWSIMTAANTATRDEAIQLRRELAARSRTEYVQPSVEALLAASLGDLDEALAKLAESVRSHDGFLWLARGCVGNQSAVCPQANEIHTDPRMTAFWREVGYGW